MRKSLTCLLLFVLCLGCKKKHKLTFEPLQFENTSCKKCPAIKINIPNALEGTKIAQSINRALREELIYTLKFEDSEDISSVEEAMQSFTKSYHNLQQRFNDETVAWEAEITGEVTYEDQSVITIKLDSYTYTGGAHGYGATTFLNFEKQNGVELENHQLFEDYEGFETVAEKLFREKEGLSEDDNINTTGFMFNGDTFHLSENIGYTEEGIQLIYNQYEVASYADGPINLIIPFEEANDFLKHKVEF